MIKPKKCWMLYLDKVEELKEYNYCEGRELSRNKTHATLEIFRVFGNKKELPDNLIVDIPLEYLRVGSQNKEHSDYFRYCIKEVNTKYIKDDEYGYLNIVFGYEASLKVINANNGIINDSVIEEIARQNETIYKVLETKSGGLLTYDNFSNNNNNNSNVLEEINTLEALKSYGIKTLEEVHEKTCACVDKGVTTRRLREEKINSIYYRPEIITK